MFWKDTEKEIEETTIYENVYEQFMENKTVKTEKRKEKDNVNKVISTVALIFDINFKESFEIIKKEDYINKILNRFDFKDKDTKTKIEQIRKIANEYVEKG